MMPSTSGDALQEFQQRIDTLDRVIVQAIAERLRVCADAAGVRPEFMVALYYGLIIEASRLEDNCARNQRDVQAD